MANISHEEMGTSCEDCGNSPSMCDCQPCRECTEFYAFEDLKNGFCPDCYDDYDRLDLEDKLAIAMKPPNPFNPKMESI